MTEKKQQIGVVKIYIKNLEFNEIRNDKDKVQEGTTGKISFSNIANKSVPKGQTLIQAIASVTSHESVFDISATVCGVFLVSKFYKDIIDIEDQEDGADVDHINDMKKLIEHVMPVLLSKFSLVSGQLSLEVSNFPITPSVDIDLDSVKWVSNDK